MKRYWVYLAVLYPAAVYCFATAGDWTFPARNPAPFVVWIALLLLADQMATEFKQKNFSFSFTLAPAVCIGSFFLFGLPFTLGIIFFENILYYAWHGLPPYRCFKTVSWLAIAFFLAAIAFPPALTSARGPAFLLEEVICFSIVSGLAQIVLGILSNSFEHERPLAELVNLEIREFLFIDFIQIVFYAVLAVLMIEIWPASPWAVSLLGVPFYGLKLVMDNTQKIQSELESAIDAMNDVLEAKDDYTERHTDRVSKYAAVIAKHYGMGDREVENIAKIAKIHDIGKILLNDEILKKPHGLTKREFEHIKLHVQYDFVSSLIPSRFPVARWLELARLHHERYDGKGYPFGLKGESIPIEARIVAVADAWDAMTSRRVYRSDMDEARALKILQDYSGAQWDPVVVDAFFKGYDAGHIQAISAEYRVWLKQKEWNTLKKLQQFLSLEAV